MDRGDKEGPSWGAAPARGVGAPGARGEGRGGRGPGGTAPRLRAGVGPEGPSGRVHSDQRRQKRSGLESWGATSFRDTASLASWQRGQREHSTEWIHLRVETTLPFISENR